MYLLKVNGMKIKTLKDLVIFGLERSKKNPEGWICCFRVSKTVRASIYSDLITLNIDHNYTDTECYKFKILGVTFHLY